MPSGRRWTRDEFILVLDLYIRHGRRVIPKTHRDTLSLGELIGRTAGSVQMRMANFEARDPDNPNKGLVGGGGQTQDIWEEFAHDAPRLRRAASAIRRRLQAKTASRMWTKDEFILVLDLYIRHGRQVIPKSHRDTLSLSDLIGRTVGSVQMRMANFEARDPDNPNKGLVGGGGQTQDVWEEFAHDATRLRRAASAIRRRLRSESRS